MKNALHDTSRAEAASNSENIKPVALAIGELPLSEGISQVVGASLKRRGGCI